MYLLMTKEWQVSSITYIVMLSLTVWTLLKYQIFAIMEMEQLLLRSKCSIFNNYFKIISKFYFTFN